MQPLGEMIVELLDRDPAPALTIDELRDKLEEETRQPVPEADALVRAIRADPGRIRVVARPDWGWPVEVGPSAWVLAADPTTGGFRLGSLSERLRSSVVALGCAVEPGSMSSWLHWNCIAIEERLLREILRQAEARQARAHDISSGAGTEIRLGSRRSTSPPPHPS